MNNPNEFSSPDKAPNTVAQPNEFAAGPPVVKWYKLYAICMAVLQLAGVAAGVALLNYLPAIMAKAPGVSETELKLRAFVIIAIGCVLFVAYVVATVLPKSSGAWIYHLVMIGIGLSSCCLWLATIPMMIAWLKPETQSWFGRAGAGVLPAPRDPNVTPPIPDA